MRDLVGRAAVITGGGAGLGAAMARVFAAEGMRVLVADIAREGAEAMADEIVRGGGEAHACHVDVGDPESLAGLARAAREALGGCDLLCANVGVQRIGRLDGLDDADWQWLLGVNVLGTVRTVASLLPLMREQEGERHVVITSSLSGLFAAPGLGAYTATKYAVTGYAETLRLELAAEDIGVTLLFPGGMPTTHLTSSAAARPAHLGASPAPEPDDIRAITAVMSPGPDAMVEPAHAIRHLVEAVRENRPYLVTHGPNRGDILERFDRLRDALDAAER